VTGLGDAVHDTVKTFTVSTFESVAVPPTPFVHEILYVVVTDGLTVTDPLTAPPVEKLVPAQLVAFTDDHVISAGCPAEILVGFVTNDAVTAGPYEISVAEFVV
jgi:hypothetical protein